MKKSFIAALLLFGAAAMMATGVLAQTSDDPVAIVKNAKMVRELSNAARQGLRVSAGPDPDTVYVGYSQTDHWNATNNYWNIWTGTRRPGHERSRQRDLGLGQPRRPRGPRRRRLARRLVADSAAATTRPAASRCPTTSGRGGRSTTATSPTTSSTRARAASARTASSACGTATAACTSPAVPACTWTPLVGHASSAWCGLRQLNDNSVDRRRDRPTVQPGGGRAPLGRRAASAAAASYPGYANQWDQMLYRDVVAPAGQPLTPLVPLSHAHVDGRRHDGRDAHGLVPR